MQNLASLWFTPPSLRFVVVPVSFTNESKLLLHTSIVCIYCAQEAIINRHPFFSNLMQNDDVSTHFTEESNKLSLECVCNHICNLGCVETRFAIWGALQSNLCHLFFLCLFFLYWSIGVDLLRVPYDSVDSFP